MAREFEVGSTVSSPNFKPTEHPVKGGYWKKTNDRPVVWTVVPNERQGPQPDNYLHVQHAINDD